MMSQRGFEYLTTGILVEDQRSTLDTTERQTGDFLRLTAHRGCLEHTHTESLFDKEWIYLQDSQDLNFRASIFLSLSFQQNIPTVKAEDICHMFTLSIILLITVIVALNYELCFCRCAPAEYEIDGRCCSMCAPGSRVYWSCTHDASTTCVPCPEFTYTDKPNVLLKCLNCTECDSDGGLRVSKACTLWSDTVCEPLDRFFCIERYKEGCRFAVQHSECRPGQYIKHAGTGSTDTVCVDCEADTYSNGSFSSCKPHTKCGALGLTEVKPGTQSADTECGNPSTAAIVIPLSVIALIIIIIIITVVSLITMKHIPRKKQSHQSGI